jgi:hypothetical protein
MPDVRNEPRSLYEILRVPTDAKPQEIERAYRRIKAEMQKETTPPDPRLRVMVEHAHDVLTDPTRREAYDKPWFAPKAQMVRARRSPAAMAAIGAAVLSIGAVVWVLLREPEAAPQAAARPRQEVQQAVAMAVGRLSRLEPSGATTQLGLAFAIGKDTLATSCEGILPGTEMTVKFGKRSAPVRATGVDEATGLCKLTGHEVGSWPLDLSRAAAPIGQPVYAVRLRPTGEPELVDAHVKQTLLVASSLRAVKVESEPRDLGAPLLDPDGRVVAAASRVQGTTVYVPVPASFLPEIYKAPPPPPPPPPEEEEAGQESTDPGQAPGGVKIDPERRKRLEKAFRPPPNVPKDL